jgi:hypothetical protein
MQHLFAPDRSDQAKGAVHNTRNNIQGMQLYHPILLNSPWQAPDDLDQQIIELLKVSEPATVARSEKTDGHTSYDKDNAIKALDVLTRNSTLPSLTSEELKPHSAEHTLKFLLDEYVELDDDAPHHTWGNILTATRQPRMELHAWVDSFTLLALRYGETVKKISNIRQIKINRTS